MVKCCIGLAIAAVIVQTWMLDGLIVPCRVAGGSMAEGLLGVHREVACGDCGRRFVCDAETRPLRPRAVCLNCGYADNDLESQPDIAGDLVLVDRASFSIRRPRRWELVAFRRSGQADQIAVKRVVGLPGELVQIRDGDVTVDGRIQRKTLAQQHAMALLVHDANYEPSLKPTPPPRWQAVSADTRWQAAAGRFTHPATPVTEPLPPSLPSTASGRGAGGEGGLQSNTEAGGNQPPQPIDWLTYHHWRRLPGSEGKVEESPVTDLCEYNSSHPRREEDVHPVADLLLSLRMAERSGQGTLILRITDGVEQFQAHLGFGVGQPRYQVFRAGQPVERAKGETPHTTGSPTIEISLIDAQFLLAWDGQTLFALPYERSEPARPVAAPLAIGVEGLGATLADLRVYRDVYYTHPIGVRGRWGLDTPVRLADDEYFVLGDNSPVSEDSRTWPERVAVTAELLVGRPLAAISPTQGVSLGSWRFQVPNPARIRYTR